jgi:SAM-dependent methyltransferase
MSTYPARTTPDGQYAAGGWVRPHGPACATDDAGLPLISKSGRLSLPQALAVARERLLWNRRADDWDDAGSAGLTQIVQAVLDASRAAASTGAVAVDLGAGSGQITIPLAGRFSRVLAVDVSARLLEHLADKASRHGVSNIERLTHPIETLALSPGSVDLVVSNYALHHLRDIDKERLMRRCYMWLRPGGQLVIGDMMFGRGVNPNDRAIIASKVGTLLRRGPAGWWRLLKNVVQFGLRLGEKPLPPERWNAIASCAGFERVAVTPIVSEAHLLTAAKPRVDAPSP